MSSDPDLEPQRVAVRGPGGDAEWTLVPSRPEVEWSMELTGPDGSFFGSGGNCFTALRDSWQKLDELGFAVGVNGARPNCKVSGMHANMGEGRSVYALEMGLARSATDASHPGSSPTQRSRHGGRAERL